MQQKFNLEAAGRLLGISSSAMRARAKKNPEKYGFERDNRGQIWVWIDPATLPELKPSMRLAKASPLQVTPDELKTELKAAILAVRDQAKAASAAADLQGQIDTLRNDLAKAEQRTAVAEAEKRAAEAVAEERARALDAAERNLADLRQMLPALPGPTLSRPWWRFWA